jgi:hypothetical protein
MTLSPQDKKEGRPGSRQEGRRAFLAAAAAAAIGASAQVGLTGSSSEPSSGKGRFVVLFEGRLIRQYADGSVGMEVMHGARVRVEGRDLTLANQVQDPKTGRTFVRILVREGADVATHAGEELIRWRPRMAENVMATEVPLVFASRGGAAAQVSEQSFAIDDMTRLEVSDSDGLTEVILLPPFLTEGAGDTTCAQQTKTRCPPLNWNDDTWADIGSVDDHLPDHF